LLRQWGPFSNGFDFREGGILGPKLGFCRGSPMIVRNDFFCPMNGWKVFSWRWVLVGLICFLGVGCETYGKADWKSRVGHYSWDQAIEELGPPESEAKTSDGSRVASWVISRSRTYSTAIRGPMYWSWSGQDVTTTAESHLLLTFNAQSQLKAWKRIYK
jgi:hypothetical protein